MLDLSIYNSPALSSKCLCNSETILFEWRGIKYEFSRNTSTPNLRIIPIEEEGRSERMNTMKVSLVKIGNPYRWSSIANPI